MARINKGALTRNEIVTEATKQFLDKGYCNTTVAAIAKSLEMSQGNLTFHYPTKEHLLAELTDMLCHFQWKKMESVADEGISSILALCLELTTMAAACEADPVIKEFLVASYTSPMCLAIIRKNDAERAREVFGAYCASWTEESFAEAEMLVSGIEFATLMTAGTEVSLERRITVALDTILMIYRIPQQIRREKLKKVFALDYRSIGLDTITEFKQFVEESNEQVFSQLLHR